MVSNIATISIAILSLILSVYLIVRDRKNKKLDNLYTCRQHVLDVFQSGDVLTVDEMIEYFETHRQSRNAKKHRAQSEAITSRVDREFEFGCYLGYKEAD